MRKNSNNLNTSAICEEYQKTNIGIESLALKYHVGKLKIKSILTEAGITIKNKGKQCLRDNFVVENWNIKKYKPKEGFHYIAIDKNNGYSTKDWENSAGILTTYINKTYNVVIPSLYDRRMYYMRTGNYWWEQWFDIVLEADQPTKKCPYCKWETKDIKNNSGSFEVHLIKCHNKTKNEYLKEHPEEREYFQLVNKKLDRQMECDKKKFVVCQVCGDKLARITSHHLVKHNMTKEQYIKKYGYENLSSEEYHKKQGEQTRLNNIHMKPKRSSFKEREIVKILNEHGITCGPDRTVLEGQEIDIFIPSHKIGIEYNGNLWHSEWFGNKNKNYHLDKLNRCKSKGIGLITIFEDEYEMHPNIVISKLLHILKCDTELPKIYGRKCVVHEIDKKQAEIFLNKYHIQGFVGSTVYIGGFYEEELVGVVTFTKNDENTWTLSRMCSEDTNNYVGLCGRLFNYFVRKYEPTKVKSFADRRWTVNTDNNLYTSLGFKLESITQPDYHYYNPRVDKFKRFHKFGFRKNILSKKYGLPLTMTETEMVKQLGYDRIWDCGLLKYVYINPKKETRQN